MHFLMDMLFNYWLTALVLSFSASIVLIELYLKSRGTPIGRVAFYTSLSSLLWSVSLAIYTFPEIEMLEFGLSFFFLSIAFMAGIITTLGAYERARIQSILTPPEKSGINHCPWLLLRIFALGITVFEIFVVILDNSLLNSFFGGMSILSIAGVLLLSASLILLARSSASKRLSYSLAGVALLVGIVILLGYYVFNEYIPLDNSLPGGGTSIETAKAFVVAGLGAMLTMVPGLKAWIARINLSICVIFIVILDLSGHFLHFPTLLSAPVALCLMLIGLAQFWQTFKMQ